MRPILERRFFAEWDNDDPAVSIRGEEYHHLKRVIRAQVGEVIEIVNGRGGWCQAEITSISSDSISARIQKQEITQRPEPRIVLAPAIPRFPNSSWMAEKLTELGVDQIRPVIFSRSEKKRGQSFRSIISKWQRIAIQSLKVNQRTWLTEIYPPTDLDEIVCLSDSFNTRLFLDIQGRKAETKTLNHPVLLVVGPPGDYTEEEKKLLLAEKFFPWKINPGILKTETAAIAAASLLLYD